MRAPESGNDDTCMVMSNHVTPSSTEQREESSAIVKDDIGDQINEPIDDSEEPYSVVSLRMRLYLTYLLGLVMLLSTLTSTIYAPLIPMLSAHLKVSIQSINLTITVYAICQALSPPFFASLADVFGRRLVLLGVITIYVVASIGLVVNQKSYSVLLAVRALQSIGGSATVPIAYGIVADVAVTSQRGKMVGPMMSTCNAISAVGPVIGGAVALETGGIIWVFLALLVIAIILLVVVGFTVPETARSIVGNGSRRAHGIRRTWSSFFRHWKFLGKNSVEKKAITSAQDERLKISWNPMSIFASLRIVLHPDAAPVVCMVAISYSVYYTFQAAIPVIFKEIYGYNELEIGLAFLPLLVGLTVGGILAGKLIDKNYAYTARKLNLDVDHVKKEDLKDFPIEAARYRRCLPFILFEVALISSYGWVVQRRVHASVPLIMQFFICTTSTLVNYTATALLVDIFPEISSTAYASGQIIRCGFSAGSVAVLQPLVAAVGRGWYFTIFGLFIGISCIISLFVSRIKGMKWRQARQSRNVQQ